jgi:hypothetical protein
MAKSLSARIQAVRARHKAVDELLHHEQTRPQTRSDWITSLKRDKLRLKDELARLERRTHTDDGPEPAD